MNKGPVTFYNDNQGAQELVKNPIHHSRTKHIDARHHFVRDAYAEMNIQPQYLPTGEMPADVLTKGLFAPKHHLFLKLLGMSRT